MTRLAPATYCLVADQALLTLADRDAAIHQLAQAIGASDHAITVTSIDADLDRVAINFSVRCPRVADPADQPVMVVPASEDRPAVRLPPYTRRPCPVCSRDLQTTRGGRMPPHKTPTYDDWCTGGRRFPLDDVRAGTEEDG